MDMLVDVTLYGSHIRLCFFREVHRQKLFSATKKGPERRSRALGPTLLLQQRGSG